MPRLIGIQDEVAAGEAIREAVACLESGGTVGFPGSTSYAAAALATVSDAVNRLHQAADSDAELVYQLALADADQVHDLIPELSEVAARLIHRCWPGPLVVRASAESPALRGLDEAVRAALLRDDAIELLTPDDPMLRAALGHLDAPLVVSGDHPVVPTAAGLAERHPQLDLVLDTGPPAYGDRASIIETTETGFRLIHAGILSEHAIRVSACRIYLFVCTGNTCRSPLAEGLFRNLLAERLDCVIDNLVDRGYLVQSAGLAAGAAAPASFESIELLRRRDIDISHHASQPVSEQLLNVSDHIFTMTNGHREAILRFRGDIADKVEVLRRDGQDVVDPIGRGIGEYERCEREIEESLRAIIATHITEEV